MAEATFNDVIKSQRAYGEIQFDTTRDTNVLLKQLIKKFEPFKKSLANKFDEQFSNEYEKEGEKIVRTSQSIKDGMSDNFKELFGTMGGAQMRDAFKKVEAGFGILTGTLLGAGLVGSKVFKGLETSMSFFGKASSKVSEKVGQSKIGTKVGGFVKTKASNLKSFMDKDLGYGADGRVLTKSGKLDRRVAGQRKQDMKGFLLKNKAVRGRQGTLAKQKVLKGGQLGLKGLTKLTKLITVPLKGISKFVKFLVNVGKTRFLLLAAVIGGIAFGIWKLKDAITQSMDYLGMKFANMGDKFMMAFSGEEKDRVLQDKINNRTIDYRMKYDDAFRAAAEDLAAQAESGEAIDVSQLSTVMDITNKEMVNKLLDKLGLEETQQKLVTQKIGEVQTSLVVAVEDGAFDDLVATTTETVKDNAFEKTDKNYYSMEDLEKIAGANGIDLSGEAIANMLDMKNDEDGKGFYQKSGRLSVPMVTPGNVTFDTVEQTAEERLDQSVRNMVRKHINSNYEDLREGEDREGQTKPFLDQLDALERVLMGKTNYDAIFGYSNEQTIDDSNMNINDDMLVKRALANPLLLKTLNDAETSGNFDDLKVLINEIRNSNLKLGQEGSNQQLNQITNNSVVNNTSIDGGSVSATSPTKQ